MPIDFGPEYPKIQTVFKRDFTKQKIIIPNSFSDDTFEYLQDNLWEWTEKVDGTNIRLHWNGETLIIGGRTNNASIPQQLNQTLISKTADLDLWKATFQTSPESEYNHVNKNELGAFELYG